MRKPRIVVGTDGTPCGTAAVEWAAREAGLRGAALAIVNVYEADLRRSCLETGDEYVDVARAIADAVVSSARIRARVLVPHTEITTYTIMGHPGHQLLEASRDAALLVVGNRERSGLAGLLSGSVGHHVATHATCPLVVVRGRACPGGPVVAGVDDSADAEHVLATAFEKAEDRGAALTVVRSFLPVIPLWLTNAPPADVETPAQDAQEHAAVDAMIALWAEKYPQVPIEVVVTHDPAATALVRASAGAQLVVVGSHGRGPISGVLLGSAGRQLLRHAECPLLIVRKSL